MDIKRPKESLRVNRLHPKPTARSSQAWKSSPRATNSARLRSSITGDLHGKRGQVDWVQLRVTSWLGSTWSYELTGFNWTKIGWKSSLCQPVLICFVHHSSPPSTSVFTKGSFLTSLIRRKLRVMSCQLKLIPPWQSHTQVSKFKDNWETFSLSGKEFVVFSNVILGNRQAGHGLLRCCRTEAMPGSPKPRRLEGEGSVGCFLETDSLLTETLTGPARCTQLKMHCWCCDESKTESWENLLTQRRILRKS